MDDLNVLPDFKDIEAKLGRKVPDSLAHSFSGGKPHEKREDKLPTPNSVKRRMNPADLKRLESKMLFLKQEMAHLRAIDVKLMQQLMCINDGIESIRWVMREEGAATSRESSPMGSLYSLTDSQEGTSPRGSASALNDGNSDGLDGISVGSYLDTLDEDFPDRASPTDLDLFSDEPITGGESFTKPQLKLRVESDEYYCFG